jgi:glycosyltransferase involved in cell wall biosynthesis
LLLFKKTDALFANDLDTLLPNFLISKIKRIPLVYDSHEFFTGVPELENRPFIKRIWLSIEKKIFPKLKTIITVNESIAQLYKNSYAKKLIVIRNVPLRPDPMIINADKNLLRKKLSLPPDKHIVILQGSGINIQRGAEEAVEAMNYIENTLLIILGGGDVIQILKENVEKLQLHNKVLFLPRMSYDKMMEYTVASDIGLTLDKDSNLNYRYSLPNKIFDYIHAGIPVLSSRLPELEKIILKHDIGLFIENHSPVHIAGKINEMLASNEKLSTWKKNTREAAVALNWEEEVKKFPDIMYELA